MTVKLLGPWGEQPSGTLYTTDATTEASMVAAKVATADLTGGVVYVPPGGATTTPSVGGSGGFIGSGNQAAMLAVSGAVVGSQFFRTDTTPPQPYYLTALPSTSDSNWLPVGSEPGGALPQFNALRALEDWTKYVISATQTVITGPCIVKGFRCAVVGSITNVGMYDAEAATGTNLMPLGAAPAANTDYLLCDEGGVLFGAGLHVVVTGAGGTLIVYAKAAGA